MKISKKHIPLEIQAKIIKSLPIKSLIRFRSVSKPWKSLIDSSEFITNYQLTNTHPQQHHLLVRYTHHFNRYPEEFISLVDDDDDTFPRRKFHLNVPMSITRLDQPRIFGSSQGLICFYNLDRRPYESGMAVLWNPLINKSIAIDVPDVKDVLYKTVVGFGVSPKTSDPKLVKISFARMPTSLLPWQVEVYTLSSRAWRSISTNLPRKSIALCLDELVVVDGVIYWLAFNRSIERRFRTYNLVISFDLTSEEFTEINFPPNLEQSETLMIYKPTKSFAVVEYDIRRNDVWIMDHGVPKSFTKLFTLKDPDNKLVSRSVLQFRKNGEAIIQTINYSKEPTCIQSQASTKLEAYEPISEHVNDLGIYKDSGSFAVNSYTESLLLLDQPELIQELADSVINQPNKGKQGKKRPISKHTYF